MRIPILISFSVSLLAAEKTYQTDADLLTRLQSIAYQQRILQGEAQQIKLTACLRLKLSEEECNDLQFDAQGRLYAPTKASKPLPQRLRDKEKMEPEKDGVQR